MAFLLRFFESLVGKGVSASSAPIAKGIHCRYWTASGAALAALPGLKPSIVRCEIPYDIYADVQSQLTAFHDAIRAMGATPLFITSLATKQGASSADVANDSIALAAFYSRLALSMPGAMWELGNEPNVASPSNAVVAPADYARYASTLAASIQAFDSSATIISGGTSGVDYAYTSQVASAGGLKRCKYIGVHPYGVKYPEYASAVQPLERLGLPIFFTECGTPGADQSSDVRNYFNASRAAGVRAAVWFQLDDNLDGEFGLVTASGSKKPSYSEFVTA